MTVLLSNARRAAAGASCRVDAALRTRSLPEPVVCNPFARAICKGHWRSIVRCGLGYTGPVSISMHQSVTHAIDSCLTRNHDAIQPLSRTCTD